MEITIRKGTCTDTEAFIALLQEVWQGIAQKEWLYLDPPEDVREMMADGTMKLWVAMDGDRLAAAFDILIPGLHEFNYGYDLALDKEALLLVANMDTIAVHPDYRGLGLQRKLMKEAENWAFAHGYRILMCTVHPENRFSLDNMLKLGYRIEKKLPKYGSVRYVLRKDIPKNNFQKNEKSS